VRLAFAVAAHLEPEILIADEVLAVGDGDFQRKCLTKIGELGRSGRTVLFVSHNLASVRSLCQAAIILQQGRVVGNGPSDIQVSRYVSGLTEASRNSLATRTDREGDGRARITTVRFTDELGHPVEHTFPGKSLRITAEYETAEQGRRVALAISCWNEHGLKLWHIDNTIRGQALSPSTAPIGDVTTTLKRLMLPPSEYYLNIALYLDGELCDHVYYAASFSVLPGDFFGLGRITPNNGGIVFAEHDWE